MEIYFNSYCICNFSVRHFKIVHKESQVAWIPKYDIDLEILDFIDKIDTIFMGKKSHLQQLKFSEV